MRTENVNGNLSDSITKDDIPVDTVQGLKDEKIVEMNGLRNLVVWKYSG